MALESESKKKKKKCVRMCCISRDKFYTTHKPSMEENVHFFLDEQ